jgi:hypothetical protein
MAFAAVLLTACAAPGTNERNEKTIFITSQSFISNFGGLQGADEKCQAEADAPASIVPSGTYLAWLSDGTDSPYSPQTVGVTALMVKDDVRRI